MRENRSTELNSSELTKLSQESIFFGHQSVGFNILEGVADFLRDFPGSQLDIEESTNIGAVGGLYHSRIGQNGDPFSKISEFARLIEGGVGNRAQVAFMKLCYVDFKPDTDAAAVFQKYRETMNKLQTSYPKTRFFHVTAPLRTRESGPKTLAKGILGRTRRGYEDNVVRERFNQLLRREYEGQGIVFDLARLESTLPDGRRLEFQRKGETAYSLAPEYTTDGGHLNEVGRRYVASELLSFLSSLK